MRVRKITRNSFKLDDDKYVNKMSRQSGTPRDPLFIHCIDRIHTNVYIFTLLKLSMFGAYQFLEKETFCGF